MVNEIERKYLVKNDSWKSFVSRKHVIKQGFLNLEKDLIVRIRLMDEQGFITIKGPPKGLLRVEFEYEIPLNDSLELLKLCKKYVLSKTRYVVLYKDSIWEIDVFEKENKGLIIAEIELEKESQNFEKPNWLAKEVSYEDKYLNSQLVLHPYSLWVKVNKS